MKKLLRTQDILLLGLAGALDIYSELKDPFGIMAHLYENLYGWEPRRYRKTHYYQTVYHGLKTGYIKKVIKNGKPYLRLTSAGRDKIQRDFPLVRRQNQKWDGKWRVVIFDIKEKQRKRRDVLRRKLKELGFGMIQESVWISPHDVAKDFREFVINSGLKEEVFLMEVSGLLAGNKKALAAKIWPLKKINSSYKDLCHILIEIHDRVKKSMVGTQKERGNLRQELKKIKGKYLKILIQDPCLPQELLPEGWYGDKVEELLKSAGP